jgi:hypothetical protein
MSADTSKDPIPYRKDLRKKMGQEDQESERTNDLTESNTNKDYNKSSE